MSTRKDYEDIIKGISFIEITPVKKDFDNGRFIVRGKIKRRDVLLKVLPKSDVNRVDSYKKEFMVDKILDKHNMDITKPVIIKAEVLTIGENKKYFWIIRKYYSGTSLSNYYPDKAFLRGYDVIRKKFLLYRSRIIDSISENIISSQKMTKDLRKLNATKSSMYRRYETEYDIGIVIKTGECIGRDLTKVNELLGEHKKIYYSNEFKVANMGDLVPPNIIIRDVDNVIFSDYEWFCMDNNTMDVANLWLYLWRYPKWQKRLIEKLVTNDIQRKNFRYSVCRILLSKYTSIVSGSWGEIEMMDYYKKHKWSKYLVASGESFEALMKVR